MEATHIPTRKNVSIKPAGTIEDTAFLQTLRLKVGVRVMLIHNISTEDGLANGAQGKVMAMLKRKDKVRYILVRFDNPNIGKDQQRKYRSLPAISRDTSLVPIERFHLSYSLGNVMKNHAARASFLQFPLKLSWACTAHKVIVIFCLHVYIYILHLTEDYAIYLI